MVTRVVKLGSTVMEPARLTPARLTPATETRMLTRKKLVEAPFNDSQSAVRTSISGYGPRPTDSLWRPFAARTVLKKSKFGF